MTDAPATVSQSEYGRRHGVSREAVRQWKARGLLVMAGDQVDLAASDERVARFRSAPTRERQAASNLPSAKPAPTPELDEVDPEAARAAKAAGMVAAGAGALWTLDQAKTHKERFAALLNELRYDEESGKVVPVADVARMVGEEYARVRTRFASIPAEHAPALARLKTPTEVQDYLQSLVVEVLEELTRDAA